MHFHSPFMIRPMDPLLPAGISEAALMWAVPCMVCVGRPVTPVCVWQGWGEGVRAGPLFTLPVFRCSAWPGVHHKPADAGTNAAVKHQSWQLTQTFLITACSFGHTCVSVCIWVHVCPITRMYIVRVWVFNKQQPVLPSAGSWCQKNKINSGGINNISGKHGNKGRASKMANAFIWVSYF